MTSLGLDCLGVLECPDIVLVIFVLLLLATFSSGLLYSLIALTKSGARSFVSPFMYAAKLSVMYSLLLALDCEYNSVNTLLISLAFYTEIPLYIA